MKLFTFLLSNTSKTLCYLSMAAFLNGCIAHQTTTGSPPLAPGDKIEVNYTCRLSNGAIAATTREDIAESASLPKSSIFEAPEKYGPVFMEAGKEEACKACVSEYRNFSVVLEESIQKSLPGVPVGKTVTMQVVTEENLMDEKNGTLRMKRRQSRPRLKPVQTSRLEKQFGHKPEIGERITPKEPGQLPFTIIKEEFPTTLVEFDVRVGQPFDTPFGPAVIVAVDETNFWITINPQEGHLIRTGNLIGKVMEVDETHMLLDYRNPFGYEKLNCEAEVVQMFPRDGKQIPDATAMAVSTRPDSE